MAVAAMSRSRSTARYSSACCTARSRPSAGSPSTRAGSCGAATAAWLPGGRPDGAALAGAAGGGAFAGEGLLDRGRGVRVPLGQLGEGHAGLVLLAEGFQRHAELQQVVRRLRR